MAGSASEKVLHRVNLDLYSKHLGFEDKKKKSECRPGYPADGGRNKYLELLYNK
jgi:hypothetical protein